MVKTKKPLFDWQWRNDDGKWTSFNDEDTATIEEGFEDGPKLSTTDLTFNKGFKTIYKFDYKKMTQSNLDSGKSRKIRRRDLIRADTSSEDESGDSDSDVGYMKIVRTHSGKASKKGTLHLPKYVSSSDEEEDSDTDDAPAKKKKIVSKGGKPSAVASSSSGSDKLALPVGWIKAQAALGAQSKRSQKAGYGAAISKDKHGSYCFDEMIKNEERNCGDWAVFYHSYSLAALLYEVQAAVGCVLFRFRSQFATLPRLLKASFDKFPDAPSLRAHFPKFPERDHNKTFRSVAISATSSLLAGDSEAPPTKVFLVGYSCSDLSFRGVLEDLLKSCGVPEKKVKGLAGEIIKISEKFGLDVSQFGGKSCASGRAGHLLQIFIRRSLVNELVYPCVPYGVPDPKRDPLDKFLAGKGPVSGQIRILCNPSRFMKATCVRMHVYSADPTFHSKRAKFQAALTELLEPILGNAETRKKAAAGLYGGKLPSWYSSKDQSKAASK